MPEPVKPRLVELEIPMIDAREFDVAIIEESGHFDTAVVLDHPTNNDRFIRVYRDKFLRSDGLWDGRCLGDPAYGPSARIVAVYRLVTEPTTPDPRAADAEALERLDRWMRQHSTGARIVIEFTPSMAGGEEFYEAILCDSIVEGRGKVVFDKAPTLAAAILAALAKANGGES